MAETCGALIDLIQKYRSGEFSNPTVTATAEGVHIARIISEVDAFSL